MTRPSATPKLIIGIIGLGYWGEKLLRACLELHLSVVATDKDPQTIRRIRRTYPGLRQYQDAKSLLHDPRVDACIIATPPLSHFDLALDALRHHKHILVEKPMTQNEREAKQLIKIAAKHKRILMVDHIYLFSPMVQHVKHIIQTKQIGSIRAINATRTIGRIHPGSTVLWDLAPHDISVASYLLNAFPTRARLIFHGFNTHTALSQATYELSYPAGKTLTSHVNWSAPKKKRSMEIIGRKKTLRLTWKNGRERLDIYRESSHTAKPKEEPIKSMLMHFLSCINSGHRPLPDGTNGYMVTKIITALHHSLKKNGAAVQLRYK